MGEKSGGLMNMLIVAVIATILIGGYKLVMPHVQDSITGGIVDTVDNEFSSQATE